MIFLFFSWNYGSRTLARIGIPKRSLQALENMPPCRCWSKEDRLPVVSLELIVAVPA
jgi:hypothetical protein